MKYLHFWEYFFCCCVKGMCSVLIGYSFYTIKSLLQTAHIKKNPKVASKYISIFKEIQKKKSQKKNRNKKIPKKY